MAELINSSDARNEDRIEVSANDIAQQKQAMKKVGAAVQPASEPPAKPARQKPGRKPGSQVVAPAAAQPAPAPAAPADVFVHIEAIKAAVSQLGADQVRRIVGLFV